MLAIIDNYDSFTYNLIQLIEENDVLDYKLFRNDDPACLNLERYNKILLSPGPGIPDEAGYLKKIIQKYAPTKNILGVCLGQQALAEVFGCRLIQMNDILHGVASEIHITDHSLLYKNLGNTITVGRYHSWVIDSASVNDQIIVTAVDNSGNIMSVRHRDYKIHAVQYHPESILTPTGHQLLRNWLYSDR